jgi:hypothetical protein
MVVTNDRQYRRLYRRLRGYIGSAGAYTPTAYAATLGGCLMVHMDPQRRARGPGATTTRENTVQHPSNEREKVAKVTMTTKFLCCDW